MPSREPRPLRHARLPDRHIRHDLLLAHLPGLHPAVLPLDEKRRPVRRRRQLPDPANQAHGRSRRRIVKESPLAGADRVESAGSRVHEGSAAATPDEMERRRSIAPRGQQVRVAQVGELRGVKDCLLKDSSRLHEARRRPAVEAL